jgi:hypothetical protein
VSILLVGLLEDVAVELVSRLVRQGDEVRVLETSHEGDLKWKDLGAHVAVGPMDDWDLVERAATNVRTLVLGPELQPSSRETVEQILRGARQASVGRVVVCTPEPDEEVLAALRAGPFEYVALSTGKRGLIRRGSDIEVTSIAEAIDAADDLAGEPRLELDLTSEADWAPLRLPSPERSG